MQSRNRLRLVAYVAPPLALLTVALSVSCRDISKPTAPLADEWAEGTLVNMAMRSRISLVTKSGMRELRSISQQVPIALLGGAAAAASVRAPDAPLGVGRIEVRHVRDKSGKRRSVGLYFDQPVMPPKFIYTFEDGRIQSVVNATYSRRGTGFIRTKSRVTLFDSAGAPKLQIDVAPEQTARLAEMTTSSTGLSRAANSSASWFSAMAALAVRDVSEAILPRKLYAEEEGACFSEYLAYLSASFTLAAANTALAAASVSCPETTITCFGIPAALAYVANALSNWSAALDRLLECTQRSQRNDAGVTRSGDTGGTGGTGSGSKPSGDESLDSLSSSLTNTIREFIQTAADSGNYACTDDGSHCVYY